MTGPEELRNQKQQGRFIPQHEGEHSEQNGANAPVASTRPTIAFDELKELTPRQESDGRLLVMRPEDFERFFHELVNAIDTMLQNGNRAADEATKELDRQGADELVAIRSSLADVLEKLRVVDSGKRNEELERFRFDWIQNELREIRARLEGEPRKRHRGPWWKFW